MVQSDYLDENHASLPRAIPAPYLDWTKDFILSYLQILLSASGLSCALIFFAVLSLLPHENGLVVIAAIFLAVPLLMFTVALGILVLLTPLMLIGIIAKRQWSIISLYPAYAISVCSAIVGINCAWTNEHWPAFAALTLSAVLAFLGARHNLKLIEKLNGKARTYPEILGCGKLLIAEQTRDNTMEVEPVPLQGGEVLPAGGGE
jgi:hypothetical protein